MTKTQPTQDAFDEWWDSNHNLNEINPCMYHSFEYWAWEGWHAALAQPAQEPVAWQWLNSAHFRKKIPKSANKTEWSSVYTVPQQRPWVGLTEEEVNNFLKAVWPREATPADYIRAIEAKLKEKNT
jgi:hypothetical protein